MLSYMAFTMLCALVVIIVMAGLFCMLHSSMCDKYNELFKELANLKKE
nr:MAG TPA: Lipopolysaccharide assembly protein A domain [Caudoviricetes sp.]